MEFIDDSTIFARRNYAVNSPLQNRKGQYVIGTFTADATTQTITHEYRVDYPTGSANRPRLNAYQLRVVPEPSTFVLLTMAGLTLLLVRFRRKK